MKPLLLLLVPILASVAPIANAQYIPGYNYDEDKIPPYTLLDPLTLTNGTAVTTAKQWQQQRRPQLLHLFEENEFGVTPASAHVPLRAHIVEEDLHALGGKAIRRQVDLSFTPQGPSGPHMRLLIYLPAGAKHVPIIVGLNFGGNQTVLDDPAIQPTPVWSKPKPALILQHAAPDPKTRGSQTQEWQVEMLLAHGYGLATVYYGDLEADVKDASQTSIRQLFPQPEAPDTWGAIGAWAWGLSRAVDYLVIDKRIDPRHIAVTGHSRLGKVADWAAAQDPRFTAILSTESGHGGQSIQRRALGESVEHLEHSFPYWFCPAYAQWAGHDQQIPVDGNLLLALIAPRPLYVASAQGDEWSDPKGEFLSALSASRVYALLGHPGLTDQPMPAPDTPITSPTVAYHDRTGKHDVTAYDWQQYLLFLDRVWGAPKL